MRRSARIALPLSMTLLSIGCGANPQASPPGFDKPAGQASPTIVQGVDMVGEWDVASFEGYRPERLRGTLRAAVADFGEQGVRLRMECNHSGRAGTVEGGRFLPARDDDGGQTVMSCGPERNAREGRFFSFFDKASTIERLGPDRVRLRSDETELVLERPALRRVGNIPTPAQMRGSWRMVELTRYLPGGGYAGGGVSEVPGRIVIADGRASYSRCPQYAVAFRISDAGRLEKTGGTAPPAKPADCRELAAPPGAPMMSEPADVLRLLHAGPAVERAGDDTLLLSTDDWGLLVTTAPCRSQEQSNDHKTFTTVDCASPE